MRTTTVSIRNDVADELAYALSCRPDSYQACVLLGTISAGRLDVAGYSDLSVTDGPVAFARELVADWRPMARRIRRADTEISIVGWASYVPQRVDVLDAEAFVQRTFFNLNHHIALLAGPEPHDAVPYRFNASGELARVSLAESPKDGALP